MIAQRSAAPDTGSRRAAIYVVGVLVVFAAGLTGLARNTSSRREPVLTRLDLMSGSDPARRAAARAELLENSGEYAPILVSVIRRGRSRWHTQILPWLDDVPSLARQRTRQIQLERQAIEVLQRMGTNAAPAVLDLLAETRFGGRDTAVAILRAYGPAVLPCLTDAAKRARPAIRPGALVALGKFSYDQIGSLAPFREAMSDAEPAARVAAVWGLCQMQDRSTDVIPDLASALEDSRIEVQRAAVSALRTFGPQASSAVPSLRTCLEQAHDSVRTEAAMTLATIGSPAAKDAEPELLLTMRQRVGAPAREAAVALVQLGLHHDEAVTRLRGFLRHRDSAVRIRTFDSLRGIGSRGSPFVPDLLAALDNDDDRDNRAALNALRNIQPDAIPDRYRQPRRRQTSPP